MSASFLSRALAPAARIMSRLRFSQKLILLSLTFLIPMTGVSWMLWQEKSSDIVFSQSEMQGLSALEPLIDLQAAVQAHRSDMAQLLNHGDVKQEQLTKEVAAASEAIAALDAWIVRDGAGFKLSEQWESIRSDWAQLQQRGQGDDPAENLKAHTALVNKIINFASNTADASNLSLDPVMASYALADLVTAKIPTALNAVGELRNAAAAKGHAGGPSAADARSELMVLARVLDIAFGSLPDDLHRAFDADATVAANLTPKLDAAAAAERSFESSINDKVIASDSTQMSASEILDSGAKAKATMVDLDKAAIPELSRVLAARQHEDVQGRTAAIVAVSIGVMVAFYLFLGFLQSFALALRNLSGAAGQLARNEFPDVIELHSKDELQDIGNELMTVSRALKQHASEQAAHIEQQAKLTAGLANAGIGIMIANADGIIEYVNESGTRYMEGAAGDIRTTVPDFEARKLVGRSFDIFHRNPHHQRNLLANLDKALHSKIRIGSSHFELNVSPILGANAQRLGAVVEWIDRTAQVNMDAKVSELIQAASDGDYSRRLVLDGLDGDFKSRAQSMNQLLDGVETGLGEIERVMSAVADGDLTQLITRDFNGQMGKLSSHVNATVGQLSQIVGQIKASADSVQTAAREIAMGNSDLSGRTEQQAAQIEETASSMEELTSTVKRNADNARQASKLAGDASGTAGKGGEIVAQVVTNMSAIEEASRKVAEIVNVIDGIAFQTNILALNAAVEAARAGEQGRGFSVVASEVRSLAQRAASSAKEIKGLIANSMEKVNAGSELVNAAGQTMGDIVTGIQRVTAIMSEISEASREQSSGIEQINTAIVHMDEVTQQNAALVEEASASARSLEEQAMSLTAVISAFRTTAKPMTAFGAAAQRKEPEAVVAARRTERKSEAFGLLVAKPAKAEVVPMRKPAHSRAGLSAAPKRAAAIADEGTSGAALSSPTAWQEF